MRKTLVYLGLLLVVSAGLTFALCTKNKVESNTMTVAELKAKKGLDLIALWDASYGTNGFARSNPNKPNRPTEATVLTVTYDLEASITGGILSGDVSPDAYTAGGQKFSDTTSNTGSVGLWGCNRTYTAPNTGQSAGTNCDTQGSGGWCRVYSADFVTYAIKLSKFVSN